ncbi:MAG: hypothetical protein NVS3B3_09610 [Aquirhabdus sp.]
MLYGKNGFLTGKLVKSLAITPLNGRTRLWNDKYTVTFSQIRNTSPVNLAKIYKFDELDDKLSDSEVTTVEKCDGSIDVVNDTFPAPANFSASGLLRVNGWLAASADKAMLPEAVYVVLTDDQGKRKYFRTRPTARPDVGAYFKKQKLNESGYTTMADISALEGKYTLGLAMKMSGKVKLCSQFTIPAMITN